MSSKSISSISQETFFLSCLTALVSSILLYLHTISPGLEGGMDSYNHFLIAKNTWSHPSLFLDQWGKPIYNIIASPFTQFGLTGSVILNVICLICCSIFAFRAAKKLGYEYPWLVYSLCILSPIFLDNTISSLTEPLCALFVMLSIYLFIAERYNWCAVIAGFLPYVRSEGFIILGIVALFLIFSKKEYKTLLLLGVGSLIFNLLGWVIEGKPFWIITENPYLNFELSGRNVCGKGGLFHYIYAGHYTFGFLTSGLLAASSLLIPFSSLRSKSTHSYISLLLILSCFISFFLAHSFIWWQGMMGSCGYVRVMVVIAPIASILAVYAFEKILNLVKPKLPKQANKVLVAALILNALYTPYRYYAYKYPLEISAEQEQYVKLADWYRTTAFSDRTKIYLYPYFSIIADIDPYNQKEHLELWASSLQYTKLGDILIWDSHFGPNESNVPLSKLESDSSWTKIYRIVPEKDIITLNDANFEIHVFEKIK